MAIPILAVAVAACGGRTLPTAGDGGSTGSDSTLSGSDGTLAGTDGTTPPTGKPDQGGPTVSPACIVAIRIDDCCQAAQPAPSQLVKQDPCLVPYPPTYPLSQGCLAKWPKKCATVKCGMAPPLTRLAEAVPGGTCRWKSECSSVADCGIARDFRLCCGCWGIWPRELMQQEPCIHDYMINSPAPKYCSEGKGCEKVDCAPCPGSIPQPACVPTGTKGLNVCKAQ